MTAAVTIKIALLSLYLASALYVHFRGRVRHGFVRQLTDHSTFLAPLNAMITLFSAVPRKPILEVDQFTELRPLRDHWETIREEARSLVDAGHVKGASKYNDVAFNTFFRRGWKRFYLKWYDDVLPSAQQLCPKTVELVQSIPSVNAALFALLPPGGKLGEHRDPFAGSLRYHLGLITPNDDACRIYIDGTPYSWRDGQDIVFDETYIHSAANDTDQTRVILFCDVSRPVRTPFVRAINQFFIRYVVRLTATQNDETEHVGAINRISSVVYKAKEFFEKRKKANRRLYYATKYVLMAGILYLLFTALR